MGWSDFTHWAKHNVVPILEDTEQIVTLPARLPFDALKGEIDSVGKDIKNKDAFMGVVDALGGGAFDGIQKDINKTGTDIIADSCDAMSLKQCKTFIQSKAFQTGLEITEDIGLLFVPGGEVADASRLAELGETGIEALKSSENAEVASKAANLSDKLAEVSRLQDSVDSVNTAEELAQKTNKLDRAIADVKDAETELKNTEGFEDAVNTIKNDDTTMNKTKRITDWIKKNGAKKYFNFLGENALFNLGMPYIINLLTGDQNNINDDAPPEAKTGAIIIAILSIVILIAIFFALASAVG